MIFNRLIQQYKLKLGLQMKMFIILDMKKNKIVNFSLKIIVLTTYGVLAGTVKTGGSFNRPTLGVRHGIFTHLRLLQYMYAHSKLLSHKSSMKRDSI